MFAALLFLTGGVFRLAGSLVVRGPQFGWTLVQGAFGLLLGILVLASWPSSSKYVIGCFFSLAPALRRPRPDRHRLRRAPDRRAWSPRTGSRTDPPVDNPYNPKNA